MKSILVTGAYGFLGRHVARVAANAGNLVYGIGHGTWTSKEWKAWGLQSWVTDSITLETLLEHGGTPDAIIHCAGSGSVAFSMAHPMEDFNRTVVGTLAILEFIRTSLPNTTLVLPSSAGVYGLSKTTPIPIDSPLIPTSPYGSHKKISEDLCRSFAHSFGVRCAIVRLFSVFGVGLQKQLLWDACQRISSGNATFFGTGYETRDWIHVNDASELLLLAAERADKHCPTVNGGTGRVRTIQSVVESLSKIYGSELTPQFSGEVRLGDPIHYQADISDALTWDWTPKENFDDELRKYVLWYKSQSEVSRSDSSGT